MGGCKICGKPGAYGFGAPGHAKDRAFKGTAWACYDHRDEVRAKRDAYLAGLAAKSAPSAQPRPDQGRDVSTDTRNTSQGSFEL